MEESNVLYLKAANLADLSALMREWYTRNPSEGVLEGYPNGDCVYHWQEIAAFQIVRESEHGDWVCIAVIAVRNSTTRRF
jgi:hypothetical protein